MYKPILSIWQLLLRNRKLIIEWIYRKSCNSFCYFMSTLVFWRLNVIIWMASFLFHFFVKLLLHVVWCNIWMDWMVLVIYQWRILEVGRTTLEESKKIIKVVKKAIFLYIDTIKNNFNDFSSHLRPCATYLRYATVDGLGRNLSVVCLG